LLQLVHKIVLKIFLLFKIMELIKNKEVQKLLLALVDSIFDYENESKSKIIDFNRTPEDVLTNFNKQYLNKFKN